MVPREVARGTISGVAGERGIKRQRTELSRPALSWRIEADLDRHCLGALELHTFVISLARCQTRRRSICLQLEQLGLRYRVFEATDGHALTDDELAQHCDLEAVRRKQLPRGHIGCTLSHYRVYRTTRDEGIANALIIEDDANLSPALPELLPQVEAKLCDGELLYLYHWGTVGHQLNTVDECVLEKGYTLRHPLDPATKVRTTLAYALTGATAARLAAVV